jgi:hypothetical protein
VTKPNWMAPFHIARAMPILDVQADRARELRPIASDGHDSVHAQAPQSAKWGAAYRCRCAYFVMTKASNWIRRRVPVWTRNSIECVPLVAKARVMTTRRLVPVVARRVRCLTKRPSI